MHKSLSAFFLVFGFLGLLSGHGQSQKPHAIYGSGQLAVGNYYGLDLSANYVRAERHVFQLTVGAYQRRAQSIPSNYVGRGGLLMPGWWPDGPFDAMEHVQFTYGSMYALNESGKMRTILSGGLALTRITEPGNWRDYTGPSGGFGGQIFDRPNFDFDYLSKNRVSVVFNPRIEFAFSRFYGLSLSSLLLVNRDRVQFNVGVAHLIGLVRRKPVNNINPFL